LKCESRFEKCVGHHRLFRATIRMYTWCSMTSGGLGSAWRETNAQDTDLQAVIDDLLEGQYSNPVRIIGFNTTEGWSRDVSEDVARELQQRCADHDRELPEFLREFVDRCQTAKA
jgi:hypothetical protein